MYRRINKNDSCVREYVFSYVFLFRNPDSDFIVSLLLPGCPHKTVYRIEQQSKYKTSNVIKGIL